MIQYLIAWMSGVLAMVSCMDKFGYRGVNWADIICASIFTGLPLLVLAGLRAI